MKRVAIAMNWIANDVEKTINLVPVSVACDDRFVRVVCDDEVLKLVRNKDYTVPPAIYGEFVNVLRGQLGLSDKLEVIA